MPTVQTTASSNLSNEIRIHYNSKMLYTAMPELVHGKYTEKQTIPAGEGKTTQWRRYQLLAPATTPLTEGVTPAGNTLTIDKVEVSVNQYGDFVVFSDRVTVQSIDPLLTANAEVLGQQAGNTFDIVLREVMVSGTNVRYANGKVSRVTVAAGDVITDIEIKRLRRSLKRANVKTINTGGGSYYVAIVSPDTMLDLLNTSMYLNTAYYQKAERGFDGTVVALYGILFMETTNAKVFAAAGASGIDVHATVCFGQQAVGEADIAKLGLETIYKPLGSAGTDDPLNQRQSQGWKGTYAAVILNDAYIVRLEHAVSA